MAAFSEPALDAEFCVDDLTLFGGGSGPVQLADRSAGVVVSAFRDGRFAGGRRADGTLPRLCMPCLRGAAFLAADGSIDSP